MSHDLETDIRLAIVVPLNFQCTRSFEKRFPVYKRAKLVFLLSRKNRHGGMELVARSCSAELIDTCIYVYPRCVDSCSNYICLQWLISSSILDKKGKNRGLHNLRV